MKKLHFEKRVRSYRSYLATSKRKRSDALFAWLKEQFCKSMGIPYHE
jgi:hypothetical protein